MDPKSSRPNQNNLSPNSASKLRLNKVLKSYRQCAPDSLNGPNFYHPIWINDDHHDHDKIKYPAEKYSNNSSSIVASPYSTSSSHNIRAHSINLTNNNYHSKVIYNNTTTKTTTANKANNNINLSNNNNHQNNSSNHSNHTKNTSLELSVSSSSSSSSLSSNLVSKNDLHPPGILSPNSDDTISDNGNKIIGEKEKGVKGGSYSESSSSSSSSSTSSSLTTTPTTKVTTPVTKTSGSSSSSPGTLSPTSTPTTNTTILSNEVVPPNSRIPQPIIVPADPDSCQRSETKLEDFEISCFIVGGEERLCLPQILNTVLKGFSYDQVNSVCDELKIFCSRCTPEQLEVLKKTEIIPITAPSCGLITKTDAERLCAALLFYANRIKMLMLTGSPVNLTPFPGPPPMMGMDYDDLLFDLKGLPIGGGDSLLTLKTEKLGTGLPVSHKCFGQCSGILYTELYTEPTSRCIRCSSCGLWLTPKRFVTHIHASTENHTCHWGFDSYNWRSYIHLDDESKDYQCAINVDQLEAELESFKARFDPTVNNHNKNSGFGLCNSNINSSAANKRKLNQSNKMQTEKKDDYDKQTSNSNDDLLLEPLKKIKTEDMATLKPSPPSAAFLTSPYPPPYHLPPPPPPPPPPPTSASSHSLHHSYHHFPVSTNWTPDPSVFSYMYHHPNLLSTVATPSSSSSTLSACTTSTTTVATANHHNNNNNNNNNHNHPSPNLSSPEKNRQGKNHQHLFSDLDKLLRRNKVHSDLRVQIFKEIENIIEEVRSTGNDDNVVVDTTPS